MFVEFANKARKHSGFRLLRRTVRHTQDPKSNEYDLMHADGCLVLYGDKSIGIHLKFLHL